MRILAATPVTGPYVVARYRRFAETHPQHELTLLEFGRVSRDYAWLPSDDVVPYQRVVLSEGPVNGLRPAERVRLIQGALARLRPEVLVVCGYGVTGMACALRRARVMAPGVPVVLLSDSTSDDRARVPWLEAIKRRLVGQCSAALVAGRIHADYLAGLGMPRDSILLGYDVVDNAYFADGAEAARRDASALRARLGLPPRYFLTVARFIRADGGVDRVKNLHRLIAAYDAFRSGAAAAAWGLVILGDGELRPELEAQIDRLGLHGQVLLPGFRQYPELPPYYGLASAFVMPSLKETWGLVVNEAMAAGLPVLVSRRCGCAAELVEDGRNGWTFDPLDVAGLTDLMRRIAADEAGSATMGQASRKIIDQWTPDTFARNLGRAVEVARRVPAAAPGLIDELILWTMQYR